MIDVLSVDNELILKVISIKDSKELFLLINKNKEYLNKYLKWVDNIKTEEDEINFINSRNILFSDTFCITLNKKNNNVRNSNSIIGCIDLHNYNKDNSSIDIGYWIDKDQEGNGYVTKSCQKIIEYVFNELKIQTIIIVADITNTKSINITKNLNFSLFKTENNQNFYKLELLDWKRNYVNDKIKEFEEKEKTKIEIDKKKEAEIKQEKENANINKKTNELKDNQKETIKPKIDNKTNKNIFKLDDILKNKDSIKIDDATKEKINKINKDLNKKKELNKDMESCTLMEGSIEFNDKTYVYKIFKLNGQICFTISVIINNKVSMENTVEFNKNDNNEWEIDKTKTKDEIGIIFKDNEDKMSIGYEKTNLKFDKKEKKMYLELNNKEIDLSYCSNVKENNNIYQMDLNCNNLIKNNLLNTFIVKPIIKNMCDRFEKTVYEINQNKINQTFIKSNKENVTLKTIGI